MIRLEKHVEDALKELSVIYPSYNLKDPHNKGTAHRIAKMWIENFKGLGEMDFEFTTFPFESKVDNECSNWIIIRDIEFSSWCAHHFLPFSGTIDIGYIPNEIIAGASKLPRAVDYLSAKPQVQEELGEDIINFLYDRLHTPKICVRIVSKHTCIACRGAKSRHAEMVTFHSFKKADLKEFLGMLK